MYRCRRADHHTYIQHRRWYEGEHVDCRDWMDCSLELLTRDKHERMVCTAHFYNDQ